MKFNNNILKYLKGELFSPGLDIKFDSEKYPDLSRIEKIIKTVKNKNIIHIGCADHLPLIEKKIQNNKWLHGLLINNTTKCIGIDINRNAVEYISNHLKINDVYYANIITDDIEVIKDTKWDYMILGEIIEHIDNPVLFLEQIKNKYSNDVNKILITAPNIYNLLTIKDIRKNKENINTDHRFWFSPYTITKVLIQSGYSDIELSFAERVKLPLHIAVYRRIRLFFNLPTSFKANCFSNLIIEAKF